MEQRDSVIMAPPTHQQPHSFKSPQRTLNMASADTTEEEMFSPTSAAALALSTLQHFGVDRDNNRRPEALSRTRLFNSSSRPNMQAEHTVASQKRHSNSLPGLAGSEPYESAWHRLPSRPSPSPTFYPPYPVGTYPMEASSSSHLWLEPKGESAAANLNAARPSYPRYSNPHEMNCVRDVSCCSHCFL